MPRKHPNPPNLNGSSAKVVICWDGGWKFSLNRGATVEVSGVLPSRNRNVSRDWLISRLPAPLKSLLTNNKWTKTASGWSTPIVQSNPTRRKNGFMDDIRAAMGAYQTAGQATRAALTSGVAEAKAAPGKIAQTVKEAPAKVRAKIEAEVETGKRAAVAQAVREADKLIGGARFEEGRLQGGAEAYREAAELVAAGTPPAALLKMADKFSRQAEAASQQIGGLQGYRKNPGSRVKDAPKSSMIVQSILLPKDKFSLKAALAWIKSHGYSALQPEHTENMFRYRQLNPGKFRILRTIKFGKNTGIKAIVGRS